ncbi:TonB-dependent receptor [Lutibacter sp.]|uniref:TonB-dependent receptor plug domain-containing protein n=1 Tax=Lutibacter sp. TaxID=1925666 RepID=UPI0025B98FC2|nr:TonB-dependent receptor [Lutibacter sp.]MCF6181583.1 TonB-dependent receptor [Lutibacter sp.]
MKKTFINLGVICGLFAMNTMHAQQKKDSVRQLNEVVITATKFAEEKEKVGKIIYQISPETIENSKGKSVAAVLSDYAGIEINGVNSAAGKNKSIYIRGGRDRQVLVLIDGVPVNDPSGIATTFDLRLLTLNQVASIEIMNGAASTLYGSGAATGVINIILKKSSKKPIALNYQTSTGTNNSSNNSKLNLHNFEQNVSVNGTLNKFNYLATLSTSLTNGLSEASDENSTTSFEKDKFLSTNSYVNFGYSFTSNFKVNLFGNYDKNKYDYDAGAFKDSDINNGTNKQVRVGILSNFKYKKGILKTIASYNKIDRMFDSFNSWTNATDHFEYTGKTYYVDLVNNYKIASRFQFITGLTYQKQENNTNSPYGNIDDKLANYTIFDAYTTLIYNSLNGFNLSVGTRLNNHSEYGNHWVYEINPSYNITKKLKLISSYSTAFIAPSTYQLFSQYGNVDLKPEENKTTEGGFEFEIQNKIDFSMVYFYREEKNAIILPDFIKYSNENSITNAKGVEANLNFKPLKQVTFKLGYAYTYKSSDLDYIPKNKFTALLETATLKNTYLSLQFKNTSKRTYFDQWGSGSNINIAGYSLVDFYGSHQLIKNTLSLFVQVNNIFNKNYVETIGYTTKGRNFKIGLDFKF